MACMQSDYESEEKEGDIRLQILRPTGPLVCACAYVHMGVHVCTHWCACTCMCVFGEELVFYLLSFPGVVQKNSHITQRKNNKTPSFISGLKQRNRNIAAMTAWHPFPCNGKTAS